MCMNGFLRTEMLRRTLSQELQVIVGPLPESVKQLRHVTLSVPASPQVYAQIDPDAKDIGRNKTYNATPIYPGQDMEFTLGPSQSLAAMVDSGTGLFGVIVQYFSME